MASREKYGSFEYLMRYTILILFSLLISSHLLQAEEPFLIKENPEEIILSSGGATFVIFLLDDKQLFKIKDGTGITAYYRYMADKKYIYLKGNSLKKSMLIDEEDKKEIKLIFQNEPEFQMELNLSIKKTLPCLFAKSSLRNVSSNPQNNIGFEWFANSQFKKYLAREEQIYTMPEAVGTDITRGMMTKVKWHGMGPSRKEKWVYLLPLDNKSNGLGIVSKEITSFGVREDRFVYWGEQRGFIEEGDSLSYDFVLIPTTTIDEFKNILKILE